MEAKHKECDDWPRGRGLSVSSSHGAAGVRVKETLRLLAPASGYGRIEGPHVCCGCGRVEGRSFSCCGAVVRLTLDDRLNPEGLKRLGHDAVADVLDRWLEPTVRCSVREGGHPAIVRLDAARRSRNRRFAPRRPLDLLIKVGVADTIVGYSDLVTLAALTSTCAALQPVIMRTEGAIVRAAALAKFPVLKLQLDYLPHNANFKQLYARHVKLANEFVSSRPLPLPATTLDDYLFVAQVSIDSPKSTFAYVAKQNDDTPEHFDVLTGPIDRTILDSIFKDGSKACRVLLTCLRKAAATQVVLYASTLLDEIDGRSGYAHCGMEDLPLKRGIEAYLNNVSRDDSDNVTIEAYIVAEQDHPPFTSGRLSFQIKTFGPNDVEELSLSATLVMLEHDLDFT